MKIIREISASFTGKISTGSFENESPYFSIKEIIEDESALGLPDEAIAQRQKKLHEICYNQFKAQAERASIDKIAKQYQNIRFYDTSEGVRYPSVTSIIGWDADFYMAPDQLNQYGARGTIIHKQVEIFLKTGKWLEPKDIPEIYPELVILKQGDLGLTVDDVNFRDFYKDFPFKVISTEETLINHEHKYAGRRDIKGIIESSNKGKWEKVEGILFDVPTCFDVKSGSIDKTKCMKQQQAYAMCDPEIKQMILIPLTNDNKCGYAKPIIETNMEKYSSLFLRDRENFRKRFNV